MSTLNKKEIYFETYEAEKKYMRDRDLIYALFKPTCFKWMYFVIFKRKKIKLHIFFSFWWMNEIKCLKNNLCLNWKNKNVKIRFTTDYCKFTSSFFSHVWNMKIDIINMFSAINEYNRHLYYEFSCYGLLYAFMAWKPLLKISRIFINGNENISIIRLLSLHFNIDCKLR